MRRSPRSLVSILGLAAAALGAGGCYRPSLDSCQYQCNTNGGAECPAGLACSAEHWCVAGANDLCGPLPVDASTGGDALDAVTGGCGFSVISNIDPCALGLDEPSLPWALGAGTTTIVDTSQTPPVVSGTIFPADGIRTTVTLPGPPSVEVALIAVGNVELLGALQIVGTRPLILVSHGAMIVTGSLTRAPHVRGAPFCVGTAAGNPGGGPAIATGGAGGGGGGAFGGSGARGGGGGASTTANGGVPGQAGLGVTPPAEQLTPLRGGCNGGDGGDSDGNGGTGGAGGGGLQLIASTAVVIGASGRISANGEGGGAGGGGGGSTISTGGGGGGAGGGILIEAPMVRLMNGAVCANGGGGGSRQQPAITRVDCGAPAGAPGTAGNDGGGDGATGSTTPTAGQVGANGLMGSSGHGGGGGGGGLGRIRVRGTVTAGSTTFSPPYTD